MRPSLRAVLDEAKVPTHCCEANVASQLLPLMQVALNVQVQVATLRQKMALASMDDPTYDPNTNRLEQTLGSMERRAAHIVADVRGLRDDFRQLDRYSGEIEADVTAHIEAQRRKVEMIEPPEPDAHL